jgi:hypothetical protein
LFIHTSSQGHRSPAQQHDPPDQAAGHTVDAGQLGYAASMPDGLPSQPAPLNTDAGRDWLLRMIDLVQPNVVILDNVMSLISGVMKEEETWQQTLPLVLGITALGKAQIWLDHIGWNSDRQYGTSTKGWFFDARMIAIDGERVRDLTHQW